MTLIATIKSSRRLYDLVRRTPILYQKALSEFQGLSRASLQQRKTFTERRLVRALAWASRSCYGRQVGAKSIGEWPLLEKKSVLANESSFLTCPPWMTVIGKTSGSSGMPLSIYRSISSLRREQVTIDLLIRMAGLDPGAARIAVFRGDQIKSPSDTRPPFWTHSQGKRVLLFSSNHLQPSTIADIHAALIDFNPQCIYAYPPSIHSLCALLKSRDLTLKVPLTLTSSEILHANTRALIRDVLGGTTIDYYGQAERVAFAFSLDGAGYRFMPGYSLVEFKHVGQDGHDDLVEIVGTGLWNTAMPLVRYRTGDLIAVPRGSDAAYLEEISYGIRPFERVLGRDNDFIISPDGARLTAMNQIARGITNMLQMQIIQEDRVNVRINVVAAEGFHEYQKNEIIANARMKIPDTMKITVSTCETLEKASSGKTPFVIRRTD